MHRAQPQPTGWRTPLGNDEEGDDDSSLAKSNGLALSGLGVMLRDRLVLGRDGLEVPRAELARSDSQTTNGVVAGDFLVLSGGLCVPTEARLRVEQYRGIHFVLGRSTWERCASSAHARRRLEARIAELDPHELASEAIELGDPLDEPEVWQAARS